MTGCQRTDLEKKKLFSRNFFSIKNCSRAQKRKYSSNENSTTKWRFYTFFRLIPLNINLCFLVFKVGINEKVLPVAK